MILFFSATGNSRFAAGLLADILKDTLVSLNEVFKNGQKWEFYSEAPFVLVAPVYAWRLPAVIEELLKKAVFEGSREMYIVATVGEHGGLAGKYAGKIVKDRGMIWKGYREIRMPDNYLPGFPMMSEKEAAAAIRKAVPLLRETGKAISGGEILPENRHRKNDRLLSGFVNWSFRRFMANSKSFTVSEACVGCGKCEEVCPMNNITLQEGKVSFGRQCMFCLGCVHRCPVHAIDYKGKGAKNGYYTCPPDSEIL